MNIFVTSNMQFKTGDFSESRSLKYSKVLKLRPGRQIGSPFAMVPEVIKKAAYDFKVILELADRTALSGVRSSLEADQHRR